MMHFIKASFPTMTYSLLASELYSWYTTETKCKTIYTSLLQHSIHAWLWIYQKFNVCISSTTKIERIFHKYIHFIVNLTLNFNQVRHKTEFANMIFIVWFCHICNHCKILVYQNFRLYIHVIVCIYYNFYFADNMCLGGLYVKSNVIFSIRWPIFF